MVGGRHVKSRPTPLLAGSMKGHAAARPFRLTPNTWRNRWVARAVILGAPLERLNYRAFALWARVVGRCASDDAVAVVRLSSDTELEILLGDFYWNRLLSNGYRYEPEVEWLLHALGDVDYTLLDCGANFGYWSAQASSATLGAHRVLAIEPLPSTYSRLERNAALNGDRFIHRRLAVHRESRQRMMIYERGSHAGASLLVAWLGNDRPLSQMHDVETICVDDLASGFSRRHADLIVKLDIEGLERLALEGASSAIEGGALFIYEDSGEDRECLVSRFVLADLGLSVFALADVGGVVPMTDVRQIARLKTSRKRGYNLVATKHGSAFWHRLSRLVK